MQQRIRAGQLRETDLIWRPGPDGWVDAKEVNELKNAFTQTPSPDSERDPPEKVLVGVWQTHSVNATSGSGLRTTVHYGVDGSFAGTQTFFVESGASPPITLPLHGTGRSR